VCSMGKCPPKFYDLKIYGKTHVSRTKKARLHRCHETTQNLPLNVACRFLDFCNYGFARIVRDLTVNLGAGLTLSIHIYY
ncbi:hypothetical protein ALC56_09143, partial [Trachymyrmex septentrionalis]